MKLIDVRIAAQRLSVSETTIRRMVTDSRSPLVGKKVGGRTLIVDDSIPLCIQPIEKRDFPPVDTP